MLKNELLAWLMAVACSVWVCKNGGWTVRSSANWFEGMDWPYVRFTLGLFLFSLLLPLNLSVLVITNVKHALLELSFDLGRLMRDGMFQCLKFRKVLDLLNLLG